MLVSTLILVFPIAMIIAALTDLVTFKIPNKISIALAAAFVVWALAIGMPLQKFGLHVALGVGMLLAGVALFSVNVIGGGDAKLLAAGALWMGPTDILSFIILTSAAGGLLCVAILIYRSMLPPKFLLAHSWAMRLHDKKVGAPYGVAIAIAALWLYPTTVWMQATAA